MEETPRNAASRTGAAYYPHGAMVLVFVIPLVLFLPLGLLMLGLGMAGKGDSVTMAFGIFFLLFSTVVLLMLMGYRSQYLRIGEDGLSIRLPPLGNKTVFPWALRNLTIRWSDVRAVDVKGRELGGRQRVYVLRTNAGDYVYFWPQWPDANIVTEEILRRSNATTSFQDMNHPADLDPANPNAAKSSGGERFLRGCGLVMTIALGVMAGCAVLVLIFGTPEDRWGAGKALLFVMLGLAAAHGLRRYRTIR